MFNASQENVKSWTPIVDNSASKTLKRLAPPSLSPEGVPRVSVPDYVFHRGVEQHREFIIDVFMAILLPIDISKVLSHVWGRGRNF